MSTLTYLTSLVQQAISRLNNYEANAKKVDELPHQTTLEPTSKLPVSRGGISEHVTVQQIISSIQNSNYNQLLAVGTITVDGTDIIIPSGVSGQINGALYGTSTDTTIPITLCPAGFNRKDILVLTTSNTVIAISGEETDGAIVLAPPTPLDAIYITEFDVNDTVIGTPGDPIVGTQFKQKNESRKFSAVLSGTDQVIEFRTAGHQHYEISGTVTSVVGFGKTLLLASPSAEIPYAGKDIFFENNSGHDITLKDNFSGVDIKFDLGTDLVVPANGIVWLKYDATAETLALFFKNWSEVVDISGKQDKVVIVSSNTTATNDSKYNVLATATFTDPTSPVEGKGFEVFVRNGTATIGGTAYAVGSYVIRIYHSGSWTNTLVGGNPKKSIEYNVTSLCIYNFPATSNWTFASGFNGMGAYGSARVDSAYSNFLTLIASAGFTKVIGGIAPFNMKLTSNGSFVTPDSNLIGGDLKLSVGYIEFNYSTGVVTNATLVDAGTYTPVTSGRVDLREDFGGEITIPKGAIWCYSWAHTKTSAVSGVYIQTILNFEEV